MHYSMHFFFMAWRLSAWHGTHPYDSVAFFFFLFLLSLSLSSHSSIPSIHPILIPSALIQQQSGLVSSAPTRLFILSSPIDFLSSP
jgi:hypothetical protein